MDPAIKEQILFVLDDDNEVMASALDSDLDQENKRMNRRLIARHNRITAKVEKGQELSWDELLLVEDANEIHLNDRGNLNGRHEQAKMLAAWIKEQTKRTIRQAVEVIEKQLDGQANTPASVYRALHVLWEEATSSDRKAVRAFADDGRCLKCGSKVSLADVADTLVYVGEEIVKRYDGDITNRNCVRCTYPWLYPDWRQHDEHEGVARR